MKTAVWARYGTPEVLQVTEREKPIPKDDEVLIKMRAVSINDWDYEALHGRPFVNRIGFGLLKPKGIVLGCDVAGIVEAVGKNVKQFRPGDEVHGDLCQSNFGGFAEYVTARASSVRHKPSSMSFEQAAAIPQAGVLAVQSLVDIGGLRSGQQILVNGAGGGVGTIAIQLAKQYDVEITGVDSREKLDKLRLLGYDHVIDYREVDFTNEKNQYDLIVDVKTNRPAHRYLRALKPNGTYVTVGGELIKLMGVILLGLSIRLFSKKRLRVVALKPNKDIAYLNYLFEAGKFEPIIDKIFNLSQVVDAMRYYGKEPFVGKVVVKTD